MKDDFDIKSVIDPDDEEKETQAYDIPENFLGVEIKKDDKGFYHFRNPYTAPP